MTKPGGMGAKETYDSGPQYTSPEANEMPGDRRLILKVLGVLELRSTKKNMIPGKEMITKTYPGTTKNQYIPESGPIMYRQIQKRHL